MSTNESLYQPNSIILILTICSLNKKLGGKIEYDEKEAIGFKLKQKTRDFLLKSRKKALNLLWSGRMKWQGVPLRNLQYNKHLKFGKDFGGSDPHALYLPAIHRYDGRFYGSLEEKGKDKLLRSKHHVLFQSGLYGLVMPSEPIQLYSFPVEKESEIQEIWKKGNGLTRIFIDYVKENGIKRIFDFASRKDYRELINWDFLTEATGVEVLHCFSVIGGGDDALIPFGKLMKNFMLEASERELLSIKSETVMEGILFRDFPETWDELPKEELIRIRQAELEIRTRARERGDWLVYFAHKFIKNLSQIGDKRKEGRILGAITEISKNPIEPRGKTVIPIGEGKWRYRIGNYRLIYRPDIENHIVFLLLIRTRGDIDYQKL